MKFLAFSCLAAASLVLAHEPEQQPTPTVSAEGNCSTTPPELALEGYLEHENNLELRQVGAGNLNGAATTAAVQQPAITTFGMLSAAGTTAIWGTFTYTQTFAAVPDQLPSPIAGQIGLGTLVKQGKRDAAPTPAPAGFEPGQPLVLQMQNVVVTQPVIPVMEVTELVEVPPGYGVSTNTSRLGNHTTASMNMTMSSFVNTTATANSTAAVNVTSTHSIRILPSQMNPEFARPPLTTAP